MCFAWHQPNLGRTQNAALPTTADPAPVQSCPSHRFRHVPLKLLIVCTQELQERERERERERACRVATPAPRSSIDMCVITYLQHLTFEQVI